ncbi:excisionase family DNA-binding protein [Amycolatopsis suaedae]|uniref:Helix-turn-helix domain-containing protein n=1 Tax=Amycolatopsis suaedae TaxID=2510978 RepID=A0A4Q7J0A7_9PSEU|nr:excisionase family DNA-binding protein [Amycolatopsis suaedae]RZQ59806.1 helix-turn-helix domain-containing protein [Amycolatopsis suaedae]
MSARLAEAVDALREEVRQLRKAAQAPARATWTPSEVAEKLGIPYDTVLALIHSGELGHIKAGRYYLVPDEELRKYLAAVTRGTAQLRDAS